MALLEGDGFYFEGHRNSSKSRKSRAWYRLPHDIACQPVIRRRTREFGPQVLWLKALSLIIHSGFRGRLGDSPSDLLEGVDAFRRRNASRHRPTCKFRGRAPILLFGLLFVSGGTLLGFKAILSYSCSVLCSSRRATPKEFRYRFNHRSLGTRIAERLLIACVVSTPHPYAE